MRTTALVAFAGLLIGAACSGTTEGVGVEAGGGWARPTPTGAEQAVVYFTIVSDSDDAIIDASVPAGVATHAALHRSSGDADGGGSHHGGTASGSVGTPTERFELAAGETLQFAPGSHHVLLSGLRAPLTAGQTFVLTLHLDGGGTVAVDVTVRVDPPDP